MLGLNTPKDTREHTESYYAATANWQTDYPSLQGHIEADVAIVGGGFTGVNTALELAERGYSVVLLEANRISWGATGRNGGQVIGGIGHEIERFEKSIGKDGVRAIYDMGVECCDIVRDRVAKYDIDCDLTWGYCDVALKPRHMKEFEAEKKYQESMGYPHEMELLDKQQLQSEVCSDLYVGGMLNRTGHGHCHVLNLCIGEARAAENLGVRIFEQSRVTRVVEGDNPEVHTDQGSVKAKHLVLAGNAYLGDLAPKISAKVLPSNSSVITTEPLTEEQAAAIMPGNRAVCDPRTALDYYRLTADNRLLFGGLSNYTGREPKDLFGVMRKKMLKVFPGLEGVQLTHGWSGQMGIGMNRMPQLGRLKGNVYYIQAYSGHGVAPTHMMGRITAQMIAGQAERFDVFAKIKHWSFPGGKLLRTPSFALGMLYYKMLDEL
ncbi:FAD-binding oxidoreductase [Aestuariicella sp. G3-2]|uniref:NAD(P)/FAD-dependent oxidoreductase n=1 Tax=Pseudomaricurvus albidus TaxID=2842452 RepID=UPI001C0E1BC1|nr:FAD-binding oxidoreductase [Aestuariicella albida]MBU3068561.1 FAD-binding oxidoreductase [Aestuariicella albida]